MMPLHAKSQQVSRWKLSLKTIACLALLASRCSSADQAPLPVYILAGQSNMQGHAQVRTCEHLRLAPETNDMYEAMCHPDGSLRTLKDIWISSIGHDGGTDERHGPLQGDYGAADEARRSVRSTRLESTCSDISNAPFC